MLVALIVLAAPCLGASGSGHAPPFSVLSARPLPALTRLFRYDENEAARRPTWTGGDAAHSIALGGGRLLWLFGDTLVGMVRQEHRVDYRMPHNTAAWQLPGATSLRFFWPQGDALLRPALGRSSYYWPGDGALVRDSLYVFCMRVRPARGPSGFDFDWYRNDLVRIHNPDAEPTSWKTSEVPLPAFADGFHPGAAVAVDGEWLYAYGLTGVGRAGNQGMRRPLGVARVRLQDLGTGTPPPWEIWTRESGGSGAWSNNLRLAPTPLFDDAAPEMSVSRVRGLEGWVATYSPLGLSPRVALRYARSPEGPWSEPLIVYQAPEGKMDMLVYGARAHPELATEPLQMVITYCRNVGAAERHEREPRLYGPQGIEVRLKSP